MAGAWTKMGCGLLLVVCVLGCRTPQPDLKPGPQPEVLTVPPKVTRYNQSEYPDMAFRDMNSQYRKPLDSGGFNGIIPARGTAATGMGPSGMSGGPGGAGMR